MNSGVRQVCFKFPWLFNVYTDAVIKEVKIGMRRRGVRFQGEEREWGLPGLLYAEELVLCSDSEEDLRAIVGRFIEVCRRRGLKVNAGKSNYAVRWGGGVGV